MTLAAAGTAAPPRSSWLPVDLAGAMDEDRPPLEPTVLHRSDGQALLYPGKCHALIGEPESGKSFVAQRALVECVEAGRDVLLIDGEKDARDTVVRLLGMGLTPQAIAEHVIYIRPEEPFSPSARLQLMEAIKGRNLALAIIDSVEALMTANGLDPSSRKDYGGWHAQFVRPLQLATAGPTVLIDHVVKDTDKRGLWASGAGNKKAAIDVMFLVEKAAEFGRGQEGSARISIGKDSPGSLRQHQLPTGGIAVFRMAEAAGRITAELLVGGAAVAAATPKTTFRPTHLMERVSRYVELSDAPTKYRILEDVEGKRNALAQAVDVLAQEGYLAPEKAGRGTGYRSLRPYREASEEVAREPVPPTVPNGSQGTGSPVPPPPLTRGNWEPVRATGNGGTGQQPFRPALLMLDADPDVTDDDYFAALTGEVEG